MSLLNVFPLAYVGVGSGGIRGNSGFRPGVEWSHFCPGRGGEKKLSGGGDRGGNNDKKLHMKVHQGAHMGKGRGTGGMPIG